MRSRSRVMGRVDGTGVSEEDGRRTFFEAGDNSGRIGLMSEVRDSRPSSTHCRAAMVVMSLVAEAR